ncbi:MAG: hypothetical protein OEW00_12580, partial [candidate division Zixibacteria bacterium]|nr:hypothetical protein [candidate division Zixibacteria bacterium]
MIRTGGMALFLAIIGIGGAAQTADKKEVRIEKIAEYNVRDMRIQPVLTAADTCITVHSGAMVWQIDNWVVGSELYKAYLDPEASCPNPYPYTITEINMPMSFAAATPLYVSVDVEAVDVSNPSCPAPGGLLAISAQYELQVPGPGVYSIWIPLDPPYVIEGPFFGGFYIGNPLDPFVGAAVITDNSPALCTSYNIWDTATGLVDLNNNEFYSFPGRLVLMASGTPGGSASGDPAPEVELVWPLFDDTVLSFTEIWANETSSSGIVEYVAFEYSREGGAFIEIGRDYDGSRPLRNGVDFSGYGDGYVVGWDFAYLPEGVYTLRITACDSLERRATVTSRIYLEPTPPVPRITAPADGADFCTPLDILISCNDENLPSIEIFAQAASKDYSVGLGA